MLSIEQIFNVRNIIIYVILINLITFLAMWLDKRKSKKGTWRTKEKTLFTMVLLGGGIGGITAMYVFRHKTKKPHFYIGFPLILIAEIFLVIYFVIA